MKLFRWRGRTSKSAFRDRVCTALRENLPGAMIEATGDLDVHTSGLANGKSLDVWLGRAYDEFGKKLAEAEEVIARHVRGALLRRLIFQSSWIESYPQSSHVTG
jgi:hypothetical protein